MIPQTLPDGSVNPAWLSANEAPMSEESTETSTPVETPVVETPVETPEAE